MPFQPPFNPQVVSPGKFRRFSGVAGLPTMVLKKADENGRDLSASFCNDQQDLNSDVKGQLHLREGHIRLGDGRSSSVDAIFLVQLGGVMQYGAIDAAGLTLYDIPYIQYPDVPMPPDDPVDETPSDYPTTFQKPKKKKKTPAIDEAPLDDPSVHPEAQVCENNHTHSTSPATLAFTMQKGGSLPASQNWFWQIRGWSPAIHYGTYAVSPTSGGYTWARQYETQYWSWLIKPCDGVLVKAVRVSIASGAQSLAAGVYTWDDYLLFTDGGVHAVTVTLTIIEATMEIDSPVALWITEDGIKGTWEDIDIFQSAAGAVLNWAAEIISDTSGVLQLSSDSGTITGISSETVTLSLSSTPAAGTYTAVVRFTGTNSSPATIDVTVNLVVAPAYTGTIPCTITGTSSGTPYSATKNLSYVSGVYWRNLQAGIKIETFAYYAANPGGWHVYGPGWTGPGWYAKWWDGGRGYDGIISNVTFNPATGCPIGTHYAIIGNPATTGWDGTASFGV